MAISIPRTFVEQILLGQFDNRRQLQDSPILTDVWIAFAKDPDKPQELLITPAKREAAGKVAHLIDARVNRTGAEIAPLQNVIAAKLYFDEVLRVIVPMTQWWKMDRVRKQIGVYDNEQAGAEQLNNAINRIIAVGEWMKSDFQDCPSVDMLPAIDRLIALAGLILWARQQSPRSGAENPLAEALDPGSQEKIFLTLSDLLEQIKTAEKKNETLVHLIALNRTATAAVARSVPAVKADAARALFHVDCSTITWAVVDSGIKGDHPAFRDGNSRDSRVDASFDFSNIRKIVSLDNLRILTAREPADPEAKALRQKRLDELRHDRLKHKLSEKRTISNLRGLAEDTKNRLAVDWDFVRPFVEIKRETAPGVSDHGTHVAGIIGARRQPSDAPTTEDNADGMCPDIRLYDFRVIGQSFKETEFAIIAALQYIRHLNERTDFMSIHGANLSLSIPHDVRNYGCGRTPVCLECERLVDSGVVVVAAAGNYGYHSFTTSEGAYEGYAALSITDPGNAEGVITVGATHRYSPHTYGVSFFSSRGPTGDGRLKPDLVAPGERIRAPFRENEWGDLDGTSMAAPHVSGAAAMLMARYSELIGQPRRIKQILCDSATDLGRERSFQGHGMLDVLRAFQSV